MADHSAFFYGTLMAPQVLHRVIFGTTTPTHGQASQISIKPALLSHYMRRKVLECDYPAIIPSSEPGACVRGTYVQGLTAGDQWRLDLFEGDQYSRVRVRPQLLDEDGRELGAVDAETYVWIDEEIDLEEGEWDFEEFRREKMGRWVGHDKEYEDVDEAVRKKDPTGGRGLDGHIGEKLKEKKSPSGRCRQQPVEG